MRELELIREELQMHLPVAFHNVETLRSLAAQQADAGRRQRSSFQEVTSILHSRD